MNDKGIGKLERDPEKEQNRVPGGKFRSEYDSGENKRKDKVPMAEGHCATSSGKADADKRI